MKLRALYQRLERAWVNRGLRRQLGRVETWLSGLPTRDGEAPVIFFNASTRIHTLSLNAAYSLLASWAVRADGVPVRYLVCHAGMQQCILGIRPSDASAPPPCEPCIAFSDMLFPAEHTLPLPLSSVAVDSVEGDLKGRSLPELSRWQHEGYPLGELCLPGLRWALRRHHLPDDQPTRALFRQYLRSAASLVAQFERQFGEHEPRALVLFNGIMYPEAVARAVAQRQGVPVVTHEVGLQPLSGFFSHGEATLRQVTVPGDFELSPEQDDQLDDYLEARREGRFTMAGIRFWPELQQLPDELQRRIEQHQQTVAVFPNVIFDTSQVHANVLFEDMFAWLEQLEEVILNSPGTLFVLRAHPDEHRPGKRARQNVAGWYRKSALTGSDNVAFFAPEEYVSSYELVQAAKFVLTYNSSIGLEASIMGVPVLSAGRSRFTAADTVTMPASRDEYFARLAHMLEATAVEAPDQHARNARRFLYRELYHASLDFSDYLEPYPSLPGMVKLRGFDPDRLRSDEVFERIRSGILAGEPFYPSGPSAGGTALNPQLARTRGS